MFTAIRLLIPLQLRIHPADKTLRLASLAVRMQTFVMIGVAKLAIPAVGTLFIRAFAVWVKLFHVQPLNIDFRVSIPRLAFGFTVIDCIFIYLYYFIRNLRT